jgi:hypothetical protein
MNAARFPAFDVHHEQAGCGVIRDVASIRRIARPMSTRSEQARRTALDLPQVDSFFATIGECASVGRKCRFTRLFRELPRVPPGKRAHPKAAAIGYIREPAAIARNGWIESFLGERFGAERWDQQNNSGEKILHASADNKRLMSSMLL